MIKIIPHASNNITIELDNGDQFEIITDRNHLDIRAVKGYLEVSKYDLQYLEWVTSMNEHSIRITNP